MFFVISSLQLLGFSLFQASDVQAPVVPGGRRARATGGRRRPFQRHSIQIFAQRLDAARTSVCWLLSSRGFMISLTTSLEMATAVAAAVP